jgi:hypothetical protein
MLSTRTTPKVTPGKKNCGSLRFRKIEFELWVQRSVFQKPPVIKQELAKTSPLNALQKLLWNYLIRVNIRAVHCDHNT